MRETVIKTLKALRVVGPNVDSCIRNLRAVTIAVIASTLLLHLPAGAQSSNPRSLAYYSQLLAEIALSVRDRYVEEINVDALFEAGIEGMFEGLDPYSIALTNDNLTLIQESAQGKYEGIGVDIDVRDGDVTVIAPLEGSPAARLGLRAGDKILAINETPVSGLKPHQINQMLRGPAGTSVELTIMQRGNGIPIDVNVERAVIEVHPVQFAGMVDDETGYVRLTSFTAQTVSELKSALRDLKNRRRMKSLILDLRSNGGGLLEQAVGVVSLFVPRDKLVVYTKGRSARTVRRYFSDGSSLFTSGRMVVLVDSGSASASEIVAGSLQDWDRAVVMGQETFGKGLVQSIFEWPEKNVALKLTTSKYYIPSGRLIQKQGKLKKRGVRLEAASRVIQYDEKTEDEETYKTDNGRVVTGGGGILPDVVLPSTRSNSLVEQLTRENLFFRFALEYNGRNSGISPDLRVGDRILSEFRDFIRRQGFEYSSHLERALERVEEIASQQDVASEIDDELADLRKAIAGLRDRAFAEAEDAIALEIQREILRSNFDEDVVYQEVVLKNDKQVKAAADLLKDGGKYRDILKP